MGPMTIGTRNARVGMHRRAPHGAGRTRILFVAFQTEFRFHGRRKLLEIENQPRLFAARYQVTASRSVTVFTLLSAMHVVRERFDVRLMASHAQFIIVDEF